MSQSATGNGLSERRRGRWAEAERNDVRVLEAARVVFGQYGPDAPVARVAEEAGVGMGTLYRRYGSKEDLLQRLWELSMEHTLAEAERARHDHDDPFDALTSFVRRCIAARVGALSSIAGSFAVTDEINASLAALNDELEAILERARALGQVRPEVTAIDVLWVTVLFAKPSPEIDAERLLAYMFDGLRPPA